jgi:ATP-dependent Clp protease adaptor protein ClpS
MSRTRKEEQGGVLTEKKVETKKPSMYKVLLHNDDYTTMDFVVMILETVFHKDQVEASKIMLNVHQQGVGVAGVFTRDIAETKVILVHELARKNEFPLRCSMERD